MGDVTNLSKNYSMKGIYMTFVGLGLDFNSSLVNKITEVRGANYFTVKR